MLTGFVFEAIPFLVGLAVGPLPSEAVNSIKHKKTVIQCSVLGKKRHKQKKVTFEKKCTSKVKDNLRREVFLSRHENTIERKNR